MLHLVIVKWVIFLDVKYVVGPNKKGEKAAFFILMNIRRAIFFCRISNNCALTHYCCSMLLECINFTKIAKCNLNAHVWLKLIFWPILCDFLLKLQFWILKIGPNCKFNYFKLGKINTGTILIGITMEICIIDPMLVRPKCVLEVYIILKIVNKQLTNM